MHVPQIRVGVLIFTTVSLNGLFADGEVGRAQKEICYSYFERGRAEKCIWLFQKETTKNATNTRQMMPAI